MHDHRLNHRNRSQNPRRLRVHRRYQQHTRCSRRARRHQLARIDGAGVFDGIEVSVNHLSAGLKNGHVFRECAVVELRGVVIIVNHVYARRLRIGLQQMRFRVDAVFRFIPTAACRRRQLGIVQ